MQDFPIMSMNKGDDVTVTTPEGTYQGIVEKWTNVSGEGFAVLVKIFGGDYEWFYVRQGAKFFR